MSPDATRRAQPSLEEPEAGLDGGPGGHTQLDPTIHVGYDDTLGDLVAGVLGSVLAAVLLARSALVERALRPGRG